MGNRSSLISLLKQFETKFLRNFEINGKICSVNKKVFPLRLENIKQTNFNLFSIVNFLDPDIINLKVKHLYIKNIIFEKEIKCVFNGTLESVGFMFCQFSEEFNVIEMFSKESREKLKFLSFHSTPIPYLDDNSKKILQI